MLQVHPKEMMLASMGEFKRGFTACLLLVVKEGGGEELGQ